MDVDDAGMWGDEMAALPPTSQVSWHSKQTATIWRS
jgi:hypothetical protein